MRALRAQTRVEITMTLRRGESVLLTLAIPVGLLVFFSLKDVKYCITIIKTTRCHPLNTLVLHPINMTAPIVNTTLNCYVWL